MHIRLPAEYKGKVESVAPKLASLSTPQGLPQCSEVKTRKAQKSAASEQILFANATTAGNARRAALFSPPGQWSLGQILRASAVPITIRALCESCNDDEAEFAHMVVSENFLQPLLPADDSAFHGAAAGPVIR